MSAGSESPGGLSNLSDEHHHMLLVESAISPEVAAARGYWTATSRVELPEMFKNYQRRATRRRDPAGGMNRRRCLREERERGPVPTKALGTPTVTTRKGAV